MGESRTCAAAILRELVETVGPMRGEPKLSFGKIGTRLILPHRGDEVDVRHLKLAGDLGSVYMPEMSIRSIGEIEEAVAGSNVVINLLGNRMIQGVASFIGILKIGGILIFGLVGIWIADSVAVDFSEPGEAGALGNFLGATALGILAFKGFTTITNSGSEVIDPKRNVGRAIVISIAACVVIYTLVGFAVASNLSLAEIIETQDYSLAAAARPALGDYGVWFTVAIAMMATAGGILASVFAVSRMLAMLTEMKLVPHRHFGMPGSIQKHTLVYTVVLGLILTAFFDLSRIAALGIVFYLIMDIAIHWGVLRYLRKDIKANTWVPTTAILLDLLALGGFVWVKLNTDPFVIGVAVVTMIVLAVSEQIFLKRSPESAQAKQEESHAHRHH